MRILTALLAIVLLPILSLLAGGNPILIVDPSKGDPSMYLKEETIRASIGEDGALVRAEYVIEYLEGSDQGRGGLVYGIALPFCDPFFNLTVEMDGRSVRYSNGTYLYDPLDGSPRRMLPCVTVSVPGDRSSRIVRMNATYRCSTTEDVIDNRTVCCLSYIVGSAQYWNHSIDRATFEFTIQGDGNYSALNGWNKTIGSNKTVFTREYTDWIPEFDLMTLSYQEVETDIDGIVSEKDTGFGANPLPIILIVVAIMIIVAGAIIYFKARSRY